MISKKYVLQTLVLQVIFLFNLTIAFKNSQDVNMLPNFSILAKGLRIRV